MTDADPRAQIVSLLPRLRRFACGLTHDPPLADDLVQTACLKALERWHQWQPDTSLASWMFRIVQTTWIDDYRSRQRRPEDTVIEHLPEAVGEGGILVAADAPPSVWAATVRAIWDDPAEHARLSQAALANALRPAMNPVHQFDRLESVLMDRIARRTSAPQRIGDLPLGGAATVV